MCHFNIFDKKGASVKRVRKGATPIPFHTVHMLVEDIKNNLKLFNNTHVFESNRNTKFKDAANGEFQKWISQLQFNYHPLRKEKGFSKIFSSKT